MKNTNMRQIGKSHLGHGQALLRTEHDCY